VERGHEGGVMPLATLVDTVMEVEELQTMLILLNLLTLIIPQTLLTLLTLLFILNLQILLKRIGGGAETDDGYGENAG
jgi:hypothetical protein